MNLAYLTHVSYGGFATYTAHLYQALERRGVRPRLFKPAKKLESRTRELTHGIHYQNVPLDYLHGVKDLLITCAYWKYNPEALEQLLRKGARVVVHDPTELTPEFVEALRRHRTTVIAIRPNNVPLFTKQYELHRVVFVPHPYVRASRLTEPRQRTKHAVSLSRLDFDKHIHVTMAAQALLPLTKQIHLFGEANRLYCHHKLAPQFPHWENFYHGRFPREDGAAYNLARSAHFVVDMSLIKGDGGGSQYTFLEAWDAGAALVVQRGWLQPGGELVEGENCLAVDSPEELAETLKAPVPARVVQGGYDTLARHAPEVVIPMLLDAFG